MSVDVGAVPAGRRRTLSMPSGHLPSGTSIETPVFVIRGRKPGPTLWVSAGIHGDEVCGIEAVRQVVRTVDPRWLSGLLLAVPVVNPLSFMAESRYLPDRRDLNRSFPGNARGSLAARMAREFMISIVEPSDVGIDLHSGSDHRFNHPQVRVDLSNEQTDTLGKVFGADFLVDARERDGSLRAAARAAGKSVLLFEGGEPHRFDDDVIQVAVTGVLRVIAHLGMVESGPGAARDVTTIRRNRWIRSRRSGLFLADVEPGQAVEKGQSIGRLTDVDTLRERPVPAPEAGWILGLNLKPVVHQGNALVNLGVSE
jgi:predicted deacylase